MSKRKVKVFSVPRYPNGNEKFSSKNDDNKFPFNPEHFLEAVDSAASRSRRFLVILIFTSVIIMMALINSLPYKYNWYLSKSSIFKDIAQYIYLPKNQRDTIKAETLSIREYIYNNEKSLSNRLTENDSLILNNLIKDCDSLKILLNSVPVHNLMFEDRCEKYERIVSAMKYVWYNGIINEMILQNYIGKTDEAQIEHIDLVRVPILGISFHINYLAFYSGVTLIVIYSLLYFSLKREYINTKIAFRRGWKNSSNKFHHFYYYEYMSMFQVLVIPKRLFINERSSVLYSSFSFLTLFCPLIVYCAVYYYDLKTIDIGYSININMTNISITVTSIFLIVIGYISYNVYKYWNKMDAIWEFQALEFNFELILEKLEIDKRKDFNELTTCNLKKTDANKVKYYWHEVLEHFLKYNTKLNSENCLRMYSEFVHNLLETDSMENRPDDIGNAEIEICWKRLKRWFDDYGKKGIESTFKYQLVKMINECKNDLEATREN
jgi:hypothetical protein